MESFRIIMAGNPNVGKSTLFNHFTGLHQHTGNWPGKTVGSAQGRARFSGMELEIIDTPGTYSLEAMSADEENARDTVLFEASDCIIVVCDACCPERGLFLALQIMQLKGNVVVCLNLMDQARAKGISIDLKLLEKRLGCPVIAVSAARKENIRELLQAALERRGTPSGIKPAPEIRAALEPLRDYFEAYRPPLDPLWLAMQAASCVECSLSSLGKYYGLDTRDEELSGLIKETVCRLENAGIKPETLCEDMERRNKILAGNICAGAVKYPPFQISRADRLLSRPLFALGATAFMLFAILWLSIFASQAPGELLSRLLDAVGRELGNILAFFRLPERLCGLLTDGVYDTVSWVISVMLPPMAIFFPLFTLLEDWGFLPRIAFNMDSGLKKCGACGKQALTMCMGLGCNTVGINGCRIIDSPREKLMAALTNGFVPCNGRFPLLIAAGAFACRGMSSGTASIGSAAIISAVTVLGVFAAFAACRLLSATILKGSSDGFILELPPFRRPRFTQLIGRCILDRTLFVLLRAMKAAAPAGALIWILANTSAGGVSILGYLASVLQPIAGVFGLDGAIMLAFILGLPASEIVLPVMLMCYLSTGVLTSSGQSELMAILSSSGWDNTRAICFMVFTVLHWPCFSALAAVKDVCGRLRYVALAAVLPSAFGLLICGVINLISSLI